MFLKKSGAIFALLFALFVSCTQGSLASTITVVPSEAQTQIQASINNSHSGDTIYFQAGTYNLTNLTLQPGRSYIGSTQGQDSRFEKGRVVPEEITLADDQLQALNSRGVISPSTST